MNYRIGDFSKISRLSIKTLRYYHECGLLEPTDIDKGSGYRYYDEKCFERVKIINELKELDFPIKDIKDILDKCQEDTELLGYMVEKYSEINIKISEFMNMQKKLEAFIHLTKQTEEIHMQNSINEIIIKDVPDILIASVRFKGRYLEVGSYFKKLFKNCGRYTCGGPFSMYYDNEFKDEDADIEACIPVKTPVESEGIKSRIIKGGKAITVIHRGAYETIGDSYKVLFDYINKSTINIISPSREIYIKGPGLIIPRSPKKYITEIQIFMELKQA